MDIIEPIGEMVHFTRILQIHDNGFDVFLILCSVGKQKDARVVFYEYI
jgi:hypothetical protein